MFFPDDDNQALPTFFDLLNDSDKEQYLELRNIISNSDKRYKKNKRIESLQESLDMIQKFCMKNDSDDWKRFLVCGVCWMGQDIAINTRQLRLLVDKCKSSINGALSKMGYSTAPIKSSITAALLTYIPFLKGNFVEQRQWTVRRKIQFSPLPPIRANLIPSYNMYSFQTPEPGTPYIPWNYFSMSSDASTSPETPEEREIKSIFGVQNYHKNNQPNNQLPDQIQGNSNAMNTNNPTMQINTSIPNNSNQPAGNNINDESNEIDPSEISNSFEEDNDKNLEFNPFDDRSIADSEYNFLTDPCCCCPLNWTIEEGPDGCFTLG